mmetsp:Transcript_24259/g.26789  ORF Transcript_24259/g.26789 Transcript_24259/m.26789 type:complete len:92 (-) Transcript_24259:191-466(-)
MARVDSGGRLPDTPGVGPVDTPVDQKTSPRPRYPVVFAERITKRDEFTVDRTVPLLVFMRGGVLRRSRHALPPKSHREKQLLVPRLHKMDH